MFVDDVFEYQGDDLLFLGFDQETDMHRYEPATNIIVNPSSQSPLMVEFTHVHEARRWGTKKHSRVPNMRSVAKKFSKRGNETRETSRADLSNSTYNFAVGTSSGANRTSVIATPEHMMYVKDSADQVTSKKTVIGHPCHQWAKIPSGDVRAWIIDHWNKVSANELYETAETVTFIGYAVNGIQLSRQSSTDKLLREHILPSLGLDNEDKMRGFLYFYGSWLRDGSLHFDDNDSLGFVLCTLHTPKHFECLVAALTRARVEHHILNTLIHNARTVCVTDVRWKRFFFDEYGHIYEAGKRAQARGFMGSKTRASSSESGYFNTHAKNGMISMHTTVAVFKYSPMTELCTDPPSKHGDAHNRPCLSLDAQAYNAGEVKCQLKSASRSPAHIPDAPQILRELLGNVEFAKIEALLTQEPKSFISSIYKIIDDTLRCLGMEEPYDEQYATALAMTWHNIRAKRRRRPYYGVFRRVFEPKFTVNMRGIIDLCPRQYYSTRQKRKCNSVYDPEERSVEASAFPSHDEEAAKWLVWWVFHLEKDDVRTVLAGLCGTGETKAHDESTISTSSERLRDEIVRLCFHAGYNAHFTLESCQRNDHTYLKKTNAIEEHSVSTMQWKVFYTDCESAINPVLRKDTDIRLITNYSGRTWCVALPHGFVVVRRAQRGAGDVVVQVSRPTIQGNCDEGIDYMSMGRIFIGLVRSGAWGCVSSSLLCSFCCRRRHYIVVLIVHVVLGAFALFLVVDVINLSTLLFVSYIRNNGVQFDEFNRLKEDQLSAISQQIQVIQDAIKSRSTTLKLLHRTIDVDFNASIFVTLNPAGKDYGGRSQVPDNLKALFRPIAMGRPDNELIAEVYLKSEGFSVAKDLAVKIVTLFTLSKQLLTPQRIYDFGLRALKTVLKTGGKLVVEAKKQRQKQHQQRDPLGAETEAELLIQAVRVNTLSKLTVGDTSRFLALIGDVFPGVASSDTAGGMLEHAIREALDRMKLGADDVQIRKMLQLNEALDQRMGCAIVGPSGCGKSTVWRVLQQAQTHCGHTVNIHVANPKAMSRQRLLGEMDLDTREWSDGVLTDAARRVAKEPSNVRSWIILDGKYMF